MLKTFVSLLALVASASFAQTPASAPSTVSTPTMRLRGTVEKIDANSMTLKERNGQTMVLALADNFSVTEIVATEMSAIESGAFIGTAAMPQPDGTLKALAVAVFPEAARGTGEGSYGWDLQEGSTMTNATVAGVVSAPQGRTLKLQYKGGEKTVVVPTDVPIVTFKPGDKSLLVPGAKVQVTAQMRDGKPTALRAQAGRNGVVPPM